MKITNRKNKKSISFTINFTDEEFEEFCEKSLDLKLYRGEFLPNRYLDLGNELGVKFKVVHLGDGKKVDMEDIAKIKYKDFVEMQPEVFMEWVGKKIAEQFNDFTGVVKDPDDPVIKCATYDGKCVTTPKTEAGLRAYIDLTQIDYDMKKEKPVGEKLESLHPNMTWNFTTKQFERTEETNDS